MRQNCNSRNNSQCADLVPPETMKIDCSELRDGAKYTMCRKITQIIEFSVNGLPPDTRVIRGCGWDESNYKGKCYQRSGFGGRQERAANVSTELVVVKRYQNFSRRIYMRS
ncbi:hypothetical protein RF55_8793 [Lasius niger]|uniref:Uncharacterized protein n=1 Tax=Lasius niger TaxID=67767 RepID=A0A0J7KLT6_LASNI|nr:hypothetical protein RF55_8793 [Lasius niger]